MENAHQTSFEFSAPTGLNICVFGAAGFVGRYLLPRLSQQGHYVVAPVRRLERSRGIGILPNVTLVSAPVLSDQVISQSMEHCDVVINLIGILQQTRKRTFTDVHARLPLSIAAACEKAGVRRLIHLSAIGAATDAPSQYLRSKGEAEKKLSQTELQWTCIRPSLICAQDDTLSTLLKRFAKWTPVFPLAGSYARFQPVWVEDVCHLIVRVVSDSSSYGRCLDIAGPQTMSMLDICKKICHAQNLKLWLIPLGRFLTWCTAWLMRPIPGAPLRPDNVRSMKKANVADPKQTHPAMPPERCLHPDQIWSSEPQSRLDQFRALASR